MQCDWQSGRQILGTVRSRNSHNFTVPKFRSHSDKTFTVKFLSCCGLSALANIVGTDTDTLLKITQQTCMDTVKIMQCNDSET